MELKDLLVRDNYRVEQIAGVMVATRDEDGNYKAICKEDVERVLTDGSNLFDVYVAPLRKWRKIQHKGSNITNRDRIRKEE